MNIFLIDYENVHSNGFIGISKLKKKDRLYIFYSLKSESINIDVINSLLKKKVSFKMFKLNKSDKNALDFQLVLFLGMCIKKYKEKGKFYIVSKDNGYQSAIDFAKDYLNINIQKIENIEEAFTGIKPKLLLECNSLKDDTSNVSTIEIIDDTTKTITEILTKNQKRTLIEEKLKSSTSLKNQLIDNQFKQISAILIDDTKNTQKSATEHIRRCIGLKKEQLIPIILECCKDFIR